MSRSLTVLLTLTLLAAPALAQTVLAQPVLAQNVLAQTGIPATPLPSPTSPERPAVPAPLPLDTPPVNGEPAVPSEPEAPVPVKPVAPGRPAALPTQPLPAQPLTLSFEARLPAVVAGKKTTIAYRDTLLITAERMASVRQQGKITASLDADLKAFLARLSAPAQGARFEVQPDGQWALVQHDGFTVDADAARRALKAVIADPTTSTITLQPTAAYAPKRTLDYFVSRGITAFLAAGQTGYDGSSPARITNIHVGTRAFQDRLFEGKAFSFNQVLGPINARAGFVPGLVIAGERTASGLGGGICQVSTTVFRALYGAGLTITERRNHSYQVYYYDPQGLDATVYQPSQDLKFANDTGGALWFQSDWDDAEKLLVVRVFGKARDFEVQVKEPNVLSTSPSPPDKLLPDRTLKRGERKQVDWAAQGAQIEVERLFVRGGQVFKKDVLRSRYKPWPNIFVVGK
ncbi:VanW family protein [Deinococcus sp.]|uniref:VanW family protein n=1 Tax=Deinococcus sp. TaxID=47478 RepID=UPI0025FFB5EC|nr:VanW family protein [Deinococcus sp.]